MGDFAIWLNEQIEGKDISQADIARRSGLSTARVSQVFSGKTKDPRISTIIAICDAAELDIAEVFEAFRRCSNR